MSEEALAPEELEKYREYLQLLARMQAEQRTAARIDISGIVQESLLEAHQHWQDFRGDTEPELRAWLRKILVHNLIDALRHARRDKRNIEKEVSLDAAVEESSIRINAWLEANQTTASRRFERNEQMDHLARCLERLPDTQRRALELYHLNGMSLADVAKQLEKSEPAVAGLLHRGMKKLRSIMDKE